MGDEPLYYNMEAVVLAPMKLTPRAWLACERTLLAWLHLAIILTTVATGVSYYHSVAPGLRTCAILLLVPAILLTIHAIHVFYTRTHQLKHRQLSSYNDQWGPFWVVVIMAVAVLLNLARQLWHYWATPGDEFSWSNLR